MRHILPLFALVALGWLAACSTPESRIAGSRAAFEQFPADVQQKIRAGQVDVGFTQEMVLLSLGEPARKFMRKSESGEVEVWGYHDNRPQFSFGIGLGSGGRNSAVGGGLAV